MKIPAAYKICTAQECRDLDATTINNLGIPGFTLMEIAGAKTAEYLLQEIEPGSRGLFLCGKGNNAGDALVVARHLFRNDISSTIVFVGGTGSMSEDASKNFTILKKLRDEFPSGSAEISFIEKWSDDISLFESCDFIIDGMLGTGLNSELRGDYIQAVHLTNNSSAKVYSIDIPTGLQADTGLKLGDSIVADKTFTYGALKTGFYFNDGPDVTGDVIYCDLGFPPVKFSDKQRYLIDESWVSKQSVPHHSPRHKYEAGVLYVIAGSPGLTGAAMLAAKSAWAEGLGAVIMITPQGLSTIFETNLIQQVKHPIGESNDLWFKPEHVDEVIDIISNRKGTVLLGPGLGRNEETVRFVQQFLSKNSENVIIDADGLWCLSQLSEWPVSADIPCVLTPHPGELTQLTDQKINDDYHRLQIAEEYSSKQGCTVISKGMPSVVCHPDGQSFITNYDTTVFARTGYGDVLAGKVAAKCALGYEQLLGCVSSLIDGKRKYEQALRSNTTRVPEPFDLI